MKTRFVMVMAGVWLAFAASVTTAEKPTDAYVKAMKDLGAGVQGVNAALKAEDFPTVSKTAASLIDAMMVAEKYWTGKADDATKLAQTAGKAASDMRVSANLMNAEGVAYSVKELTDTCAACHTAHRERLADGSFQIK